MPDSLKSAYLGTGLSGDINGSVGRSERLQVGEFTLSDIRTSFAPAEVRSKQQGADGILGNDCIRRFNVIFRLRAQAASRSSEQVFRGSVRVKRKRE